MDAYFSLNNIIIYLFNHRIKSIFVKKIFNNEYYIYTLFLFKRI